MMTFDRDWNAHYQQGEVPWDSRRPSRELSSILDQFPIPRTTAFEFGCGTGTNAVFLARSGFSVTAVDGAPLALELAREQAKSAGVSVQFVEADVTNLEIVGAPFDFLFDRGCYHCCRSVDLDGYLKTLQNVSKPGTWFLCLCGNANEQTEEGPPRVTEQEIRNELGSLFEIVQLREFRFEDADGTDGPLGWSVLMKRS